MLRPVNTQFRFFKPSSWQVDGNSFNSRRSRWFWSLVTGFLLFSLFPPLEWSFLAWIALVPLLVTAASSDPRVAFESGFRSGLIFWLLSVVWLARVTWIGFFLLCGYCALFMGCFAMTIALWLGKKEQSTWFAGILTCLFVPSAWVAWEYLRSVLFSGFPWNQLGVSQYANLALIQAAEFGGVYIVSYIIVMINTVIALFLIRSGHRMAGVHLRIYPALLFAALALIWTLWYGRLAAGRLPATTETLKVAAIQVNIPQLEKWSEFWTTEINNRLRRTSLEAIEHHRPDLIVWPETVVPDFVRTSRISQQVVGDVIQHGVSLLMGSMDFDDSGRTVKYFNSSFLFNPGNSLPQTYAKRHLVLLGEYIPFEQSIPFLRVLTPVEESFTAGNEAVVFQMGRRAFSVLICFEDTVAGLARDCVRAGARLLVNQTNDAWFDPSAASRQHMAQCVFRCVENRVSAVRAANTGITCFINRRGRIVGLLPKARGPLPDPEYLAGEVALPAVDMPLTFYTRYGDMLAAACVLFTLVGLFARAAKVNPGLIRT